ncbi:uncharacterized protein [Antedon mediterranea]|uniref:uncharacterized protein n=1 Tax=Antedon mediterranea TaxID=105859 RepID=UPI003AF70C8C
MTSIAYLIIFSIFDLVVSLEVIHNQDVLLQYLHDIGEILYYPDDEALKDIIVLNLMRLVDMFKTVITVEDPKLQTTALRDAWIKLNTGILEEHLLRHLWEKEEFCDSSDDKTFNFFVSLMEKFGLLCEKKHTKDKGRIFYVLSRLKPEASAPPKYDRERAVSLFHDFGSYLPDDLFQRAATKFVEKFQIDNYEPQLSFEHVQLNIDGHHQVILYVATIRQRRMLQTTIVRTKILNVESAEDKPEPSVCKKVLSFLQTELKVFSQSNTQGLKAKMYIPCACSPNIENAHLHIISKFDQAVLPCGGNAMDVTHYCRLFADSVVPQGDSAVPQGCVDDLTIQRVCEEINDNWKQFGVCLGFSYTETKEFEASDKMMHHWRGKTTSSKQNQLAVLHKALTEHGLTNLADWLFGETKAECFEDRDLVFICNHLGSEWRRLAVRLGIKWIDIDKITDTNRNIKDSMMDSLVSWRDRCANQIPTIIKALRQQELNSLACDLCRRHAYLENKSFEEVAVFQDQSKNGCLTDLHLLTISEMMDENWMEFCIRLEIPRQKLLQNKEKYPMAIVDATMHSLIQWRDKQNDDVNQWQTRDNMSTFQFD